MNINNNKNRTSIKHRIHIQALSEVIEMSLIAGTLATGIDTFWAIMDCIHNGVSWYYILIICTLSISTILVGSATVKHHKDNFNKILKEIYNSKLLIVKRKKHKL